jgi:DNA-binding MarR family transcriptional regulator
MATPTPAPASASDLDTATLLSLAGSFVDGTVLSALRARGYAVTRAHGFIFQRLLTGEQTISALASDLRITQQGASKHVAELERAGLVARDVSPGDRRARVVRLTDAGHDAIQAARAARLAFEARVEALAGGDALATTRRVLAALLDELGVSEHIPGRTVPWDR